MNLTNSQILWNDNDSDCAKPGAVALSRDLLFSRDDYHYNWGFCNSEVVEASPFLRVHLLLIQLIHMIVRDGVNVRQLHRELLPLDEYRSILSDDMPDAEESFLAYGAHFEEYGHKGHDGIGHDASQAGRGLGANQLAILDALKKHPFGSVLISQIRKESGVNRQRWKESIESLVKRDFIAIEGKSIKVTDHGRCELIPAGPPITLQSNDADVESDGHLASARVFELVEPHLRNAIWVALSEIRA